jgi:hypothetical protein
MEDPGELDGFVEPSEITEVPLTICSAVCRVGSGPLTMRELIKTVFSIITLEFICILAVYFMNNEVTWPLTLGILQMVPVVILYLFMYMNLVTGGWGASDSRFWCDVKIMYARGFNTIRSCTSIFSKTISLWFVAVLLNQNSITITFLMPLLVAIQEWQSGLAENKNQYDIKVFDKFIKNGHLCLESLHYYQAQAVRQKTHVTSFIAAAIIKTYVMSALLLSWAPEPTDFTFGIPLVCILVFYIWWCPLFLDFLYLKSAVSFCQLELYRMILDVIIPAIIACFAIV